MTDQSNVGRGRRFHHGEEQEAAATLLVHTVQGEGGGGGGSLCLEYVNWRDASIISSSPPILGDLAY